MRHARIDSKTLRILSILATILVLSGLAVHARGQEAAAHKAWMDDAADLQDELREQLLAKSGDKAAAAATQIEELLARTQAYWAAKHADDIVTIARESRTLATAVATAAKAGQFDRATEAAAKMGARCNACHDLHPEKR
jgi:hypothetical protein